MVNKLVIITVYFNQPHFLKYQLGLINKFCREDFIFICFDNSYNGLDLLKNFSDDKFIYRRVPQEAISNSDPSNRAGQSLNFAIKSIQSEGLLNSNILIIDSDMFPIKEFSFESVLMGKDFAGIYQTRGNVFYYTNQLVLIRGNKVGVWDNFDFEPAIILGESTDCGGKLFNFFSKDNSHLTTKDLGGSNGIHSGQLFTGSPLFEKVNGNQYLEDFFQKDIVLNNGKNFSEIYYDLFLHFRAGSNWINFQTDLNLNRESNLFNFLNNVLYTQNN